VTVAQIGPVYVPQAAQPPEVIPEAPEASKTVEGPVYAGFWLRAVAYLLDSMILGFPFGLMAGVYPSAFFRSLDPNAFLQSPLSVFTPLAVGLMMTASWFYCAAFESSRWQATPGKRILRIYVTDLQGRRVTFARALWRNLAKQISGFVLIGYFLAGLTARKQALHDMLSACLVVRTR
jgi:uncharacterized RDD family membrane protein YckC